MVLWKPAFARLKKSHAPNPQSLIPNNVVFIPSQGFRHAATLLLTNRARAIPVDASENAVRSALEQLARELVALADDMRAPADAAGWLIAEFNSTIDRLPQLFDRSETKASAAVTLARVASRTAAVETRDLFLIYVPEDRLPIAAPLAVELTKRRVTVAFAEYEVSSAQQLAAAISLGLARHRGGAVLCTRAFERTQWDLPPEADRLRTLRHPDPTAAIESLVAWVTQLRVSKA